MTDPPPSGTFALALQGIDKRFGATQALADASVRVRPGTVHALLGENGAGKSTLMRVAYGIEHPDAGEIRVDGARVRLNRPADAIALGIGMVHQHFSLVPVMTVAENVALGGHGMLDLTQTASELHALSDRTGILLDPWMRVEQLSVAAQQRVEIAKALLRRARTLVLDEPTAILPPSESSALLQWLRAFANEGNAVVLITHRLGEALSVADDVTVLRRGRTVLSAAVGDMTVASLTKAMLGSAPVDQPTDRSVADRAKQRRPMMPPTFHAEAIALLDSAGITRVQAASFTIGRGEMVGVAGVEGGGHRELLRALAGRLPITSGTLDRPPVVGFVPEDRHRDALLLDRSLVENVALRGAGARRGLVRWRAIEAYTTSLINTFDVRTRGPRALMRTLSGGNQQKLVLGRELGGSLAVVLENPTRGLDVRATLDVHDRLRSARDAGATVVVYSSDIDELVQLADRALVVFGGSVSESPVNREAIGRLMVGAESDTRQ